jgi:hypothetical protein
MAQQKQWMLKTRSPSPLLPGKVEKQTIVAACETFIAEVLKPRFLPQVRPTGQGGRYRILASSYRLVHRDNTAPWSPDFYDRRFILPALS